MSTTLIQLTLSWMFYIQITLASNAPTEIPTSIPTTQPTEMPTSIPTVNPTEMPTAATDNPTTASSSPTWSPTSTDCVLVNDCAGFKECVSSNDIVDGIELIIKRHDGKKEMIIDINGPADQWFGYGFGNTIMTDTYAIVSGKDFDINNPSTQVEAKEFLLGEHGQTPHKDITGASGTLIIEEVNGRTHIILARDYADPANANNATYDFTSFLDCSNPIMDVIAAHGKQHTVRNDLTLEAITFAYHNEFRNSGQIENICCSDSPTALPTKTPTAPTNSPTQLPTSLTKNPTAPTTPSPGVKPTSGDGGDANNIFNVLHVVVIVVLSVLSIC
eukprot:172190_1